MSSCPCIGCLHYTEGYSVKIKQFDNRESGIFSLTTHKCTKFSEVELPINSEGQNAVVECDHADYLRHDQYRVELIEDSDPQYWWYEGMLNTGFIVRNANKKDIEKTDYLENDENPSGYYVLCYNDEHRLLKKSHFKVLDRGRKKK